MNFNSKEYLKNKESQKNAYIISMRFISIISEKLKNISLICKQIVFANYTYKEYSLLINIYFHNNSTSVY